jgi:uncharacterized protein YqgV (UPF0045/DUF77 family)
MNDQIRSQAIAIFEDEGFVLNLSNKDFQELTMSSIGESIKDRYNTNPEQKVSKGRALKQFLVDEPEKGLILTKDLLKHYWQLSKDSPHRSDEKDKWARKLEADISRISPNDRVLESIVADTVKHFDDEYISEEIRSMQESIEKSPNDAIDKAKSLVESCFKFILDEYGISYNSSDKLGELQKKVFTRLDIDANTNKAAKADKKVKTILNSLNQIIQGTAEIRNKYGNSHGKSAGTTQLPPRYARIVVNSSIAVVNFIWDTHKDRKE